MMNEKFMVAAHHLSGQSTAENYIDECVLRPCSEPHMLYRILVKMTGNDMASRAELMGFADCLHSWMRARDEVKA
jgi:hypothetical protein